MRFLLQLNYSCHYLLAVDLPQSLRLPNFPALAAHNRRLDDSAGISFGLSCSPFTEALHLSLY